MSSPTGIFHLVLGQSFTLLPISSEKSSFIIHAPCLPMPFDPLYFLFNMSSFRGADIIVNTIFHYHHPLPSMTSSFSSQSFLLLPPRSGEKQRHQMTTRNRFFTQEDQIKQEEIVQTFGLHVSVVTLSQSYLYISEVDRSCEERYRWTEKATGTVKVYYKRPK